MTAPNIELSPPPLYSLKALSQAGYGAIATLRRDIREGRLKAVHIGGRVKVTEEALRDYVKAVPPHALEHESGV